MVANWVTGSPEEDLATVKDCLIDNIMDDLVTGQPPWQGLYDLCIFLQEHKSIYPCEESDGNSNAVSGRSDDICPAVPDYDELAAHQSHYVVLGNPFVIMIVKLRTIRIVVHLVHRLSILAGKFHQVFLPPCPLSFL